MMRALWSLAVALALTASSAWAATDVRGREHRDCETCHQGHVKGSPDGPLLSRPADVLCASCHVEGSLNKSQDLSPGTPILSSDPSAFASQHLWLGTKKPWGVLSKADGGATAPQAGGCVNCHDAHESEWKGTGAVRTLARKAYSPEGRRLPGRPTQVAQVCFGCHWGRADSSFRDDPMRVGAVMGNGAASAHRMGARGRVDLPSLKGLTLDVPLDCVTCHTAGKEAGLRGPHVSRFRFLLAAGYEPRDGVQESPVTYAACYACHDRNSILANQSFSLHREHVTGMFVGQGVTQNRYEGLWKPPNFRELVPAAGAKQGKKGARKHPEAVLAIPTSCATCHDPHGSRDNPALISFSRTTVRPNSRGMMEYRRSGPGTGSCDLECHGHDHVNSTY